MQEELWIMSRVEHGGGRIMLRGCRSLAGTEAYVKVDETMDSSNELKHQKKNDHLKETNIFQCKDLTE